MRKTTVVENLTEPMAGTDGEPGIPDSQPGTASKAPETTDARHPNPAALGNGTEDQHVHDGRTGDAANTNLVPGQFAVMSLTRLFASTTPLATQKSTGVVRLDRPVRQIHPPAAT